MNMNELIEKLRGDKGKALGIAAVCFAAVFLAGFWTGQTSLSGKDADGRSAAAGTSKRSLNYTTNTGEGTKHNATPASVPAVPNANPTDCYIKGSKSKIYHLPGGSFYERTNAAQCFATEAEAQAAGYKKSSR
jgi:hypothetical protein